MRQSVINFVLGLLIISCYSLATPLNQVNAATQTTTKSTARVGFYRAKANGSNPSDTNQGNSQQHSATQQSATKLPQTSVQQPTTLISWGLGLVAISLLGIKQKNRGKY